MQNCVLSSTEGEDGPYRISPATSQWFAPGGAHSNPSGAEASVRPWTGPAGDIPGWMGERYVDFAVDARPQFNSCHPRNIAAAPFSCLGAWGIDEPPPPIYKVDYKQPKIEKDGNLQYAHEEEDDALEWVETHRPDHVLYWQGCGGDGPDLGIKQEGICDVDSWAANAIAELGLPAGIAFDAMFFVESYKLRVSRCEGFDEVWTNGEEGLLYTRQAASFHPYTDGILDEYTTGSVEDGCWARWSGEILVIKPLPPRAEHGGGE